jgi:hypothetical protein
MILTQPTPPSLPPSAASKPDKSRGCPAWRGSSLAARLRLGNRRRAQPAVPAWQRPRRLWQTQERAGCHGGLAEAAGFRLTTGVSEPTSPNQTTTQQNFVCILTQAQSYRSQLRLQLWPIQPPCPVRPLSSLGGILCQHPLPGCDARWCCSTPPASPLRKHSPLTN